MGISPAPTPRKIIDGHAVEVALNCSRWKIWELCKKDPEFPKPRMIAGKRAWFEDEIELYKVTRPCRQYADSAA